MPPFLRRLRRLPPGRRFARILQSPLTALAIALVALLLFYLSLPAPPPAPPRDFEEGRVERLETVSRLHPLAFSIAARPVGFRLRTRPARLAPRPLSAIGRPRAARGPAPASPTVAILLDDMGHNLEAVARALALPAPVTLAFLPYPSHTAEGVRLALAARRDVLLHLPMEPLSPDVDPGPIVLRVDDPDTRIRETLERAFSRVPGSIGVNNHMGSRFTADRRGMAALFGYLAERRLPFIDSRTTARSVAAELARRYGVPLATRDVFLDNERDTAAILARLDETERLARRRGHALAIGHPHPETLEALERWIPDARARGVRFVGVRAYLGLLGCRRPQTNTVTAALSGCGSRS